MKFLKLSIKEENTQSVFHEVNSRFLHYHICTPNLSKKANFDAPSPIEFFCENAVWNRNENDLQVEMKMIYKAYNKAILGYLC